MLRNTLIIVFWIIVHCNVIFCHAIPEDNISDVKSNKKNNHNFSESVITYLFPREQLWRNISGQQGEENIDNVLLYSRENIGDIVYYNKKFSFGPIFTFLSFRPIGFYTEYSDIYKPSFGNFNIHIYYYDNLQNLSDGIMYRIYRELQRYKALREDINVGNIVKDSSRYLSHSIKIDFDKKGFLEINLFLKNKHYGYHYKNNDSVFFASDFTILDSILSEFTIKFFDKIILVYNTISNFKMLEDKQHFNTYNDSNYIITYKGDSTINDGFEVLKNIYNCDIKIYYNLFKKVADDDPSKNYDARNFIVKFKKPIFCKRFYDDDNKTLEVSCIVDFSNGAKLLFGKLPVIILPNIDFKYAISYEHTIYICIKGGYVVKDLYKKNRNIDGYVTEVEMNKDNMVDYLNTCFAYQYFYGYNSSANIGLKIKCQKYLETIGTDVANNDNKENISKINFIQYDNRFMFIPFLNITLRPHYNCVFNIKEKYFLFDEDGINKPDGSFVKNKLHFDVTYEDVSSVFIFTMYYFIMKKIYLNNNDIFNHFGHYFDVKCEYKYKIRNNIFFFVNIKNLERILLLIFSENLNGDMSQDEHKNLNVDMSQYEHKIRLSENYLGNKKQRMNISFGVKYYC